MDKETLKRITESTNRALKARGIDPTISDFNSKLKREVEQKSREQIAEEIARQTGSIIEQIVAEKIAEINSSNDKFKKDIVGAVEKIKITVPEVVIPGIDMPRINIPEIKLPTINVPKPEVVVNVPEIKVPKIEMPKEMEVKGFGSFVKAMFEIFKNQITVKLGGINRDKPLPVILVDEEGRYYKAIAKAIAGGGGNIKGLMNVAGAIINPATEDTLEKIAGFNIPKYDYQSLGYTSDNLTTMVFKTDGASGTTVATLTLAYDGDDNITSITKT